MNNVGKYSHLVGQAGIFRVHFSEFNDQVYVKTTSKDEMSFSTHHLEHLIAVLTELQEEINNAKA